MSLTRGKTITDLKLDLVRLIADIEAHKVASHPEPNGRLKPVEEYNMILSRAKEILPHIDVPKISWKQPPIDDMFDARCIDECKEVGRKSRALLGEIEYEESLSNCIRKAEAKLSQASKFESNIKSAMDSKSWDQALREAQSCIEHSLKAIFTLVGLRAPPVHQIPSYHKDRKKDQKKGTMAELIERFETIDPLYRKRLARLWWINSTWSPIREAGTYGCLEELEVGPTQLFEEADAKMAKAYAREARGTARSTLAAVQNRQVAVKKPI